MIKQKSSSKKVTHALQVPYADFAWPSVNPEHETAILDVLIPILLPIGQYHKRQKAQPKSRRKKSIKNPERTDIADEKDNAPQDLEKPVVAEHLTVGFNSTIRHLETLSQRTVSHEHETSDLNLATFSVIFVNVTALSDVMLQTLPLLAALASKELPPSEATRLVPISQTAASRIAEALDQPRAAVCGLMNTAPGIDEVSVLLAQHIQAIDVPWIREAANGQYLPLKVHSEETGGKEKPDRKRKRTTDKQD